VSGASSRLKAWRTEVGIAQAAVAACVDATPGTVSRWERGRVIPAIGVAVGLEQLTQGLVPMQTWADPWAARWGDARGRSRAALPDNVVRVDFARARLRSE
jgi:transcriptional regulator with XRE-family HTH domain